MSDLTNNPELTDEDLAAIQASLDEGNEAVVRRSILEIWTELFSNVPKVSRERVTPGLAMNIVGTWPKISMQETPRYHAIYHERLLEVAEVLYSEIPQGDIRDKAFDRVGDEDRDLNAEHYEAILLEWQKLVMRWEAEWRAEDPESHLIAAVIADVHKFVLSPSGIVEHLSSINFRYTDEMKALHAVELEAWAEQLEAENE